MRSSRRFRLKARHGELESTLTKLDNHRDLSQVYAEYPQNQAFCLKITANRQ